MSKRLTLEDHADEIRSALAVPRQSDLFKAAVEAGYLAASADGSVSAEERATLAKAVEVLSQGLVIEWETDALLDACESAAKGKEHGVRAEEVGATLKDLGQPEAGLLVAAFVARATNGVEKAEAEMLKAIGKAAGINGKTVGEIVKRATGLD
jgi:tellurite resistance protein